MDRHLNEVKKKTKKKHGKRQRKADDGRRPLHSVSFLFVLFFFFVFFFKCSVRTDTSFLVQRKRVICCCVFRFFFLFAVELSAARISVAHIPRRRGDAAVGVAVVVIVACNITKLPDPRLAAILPSFVSYCCCCCCCSYSDLSLLSYAFENEARQKIMETDDDEDVQNWKRLHRRCFGSPPPHPPTHPAAGTVVPDAGTAFLVTPTGIFYLVLLDLYGSYRVFTGFFVDFAALFFFYGELP